MILDLFVLGIAGERLAASLTGAYPEYDQHQIADLRLHMQTYDEHSSGAGAAWARGDIYNAAVELSDAAINLFFGWIVASRIVDPAIRQQAFDELNAYLLARANV